MRSASQPTPSRPTALTRNTMPSARVASPLLSPASFWKKATWCTWKLLRPKNRQVSTPANSQNALLVSASRTV